MIESNSSDRRFAIKMMLTLIHICGISVYNRTVDKAFRS